MQSVIDSQASGVPSPLQSVSHWSGTPLASQSLPASWHSSGTPSASQSWLVPLEMSVASSTPFELQSVMPEPVRYTTSTSSMFQPPKTTEVSVCSENSICTAELPSATAEMSTSWGSQAPSRVSRPNSFSHTRTPLTLMRAWSHSPLSISSQRL